jgi:hypothetical protein
MTPDAVLNHSLRANLFSDELILQQVKRSTRLLRLATVDRPKTLNEYADANAEFRTLRA